MARTLAAVDRRTRGVLELGGGGGRDSAALVAAGHKVIGVDLSALSLEEGVIDRYDHPKWIWEAALERTSTASP